MLSWLYVISFRLTFRKMIHYIEPVQDRLNPNNHSPDGEYQDTVFSSIPYTPVSH
jgi:hypothetical protein